MNDLGRLIPPFPVDRCVSATCGKELGNVAFLFKDLDTGKLCIFCGECSLYVELQRRDRFLLVPL